MLLLHRLSRRQHPFPCAPWMDFWLKQARFDGRIVLQQRRGLLRSYAEDVNCPQLARNAQREQSGNGQISLRRHLFDESRMLLHYEIKSKRVRFPSFTPLHQNKCVLLHSGSLSRMLTGAPVNEPPPMNLGG